MPRHRQAMRRARKRGEDVTPVPVRPVPRTTFVLSNSTPKDVVKRFRHRGCSFGPRHIMELPDGWTLVRQVGRTVPQRGFYAAHAGSGVSFVRPSGKLFAEMIVCDYSDQMDGSQYMPGPHWAFWIDG